MFCHKPTKKKNTPQTGERANSLKSENVDKTCKIYPVAAAHYPDIESENYDV